MAVRPTFMGFETASRGLMVNQKALDIVGHNLGNIGVTGYTRQRVDLVSLNTNMRYTRYSVNSTALAGQGVNTYGISQIRDQFLDKRFREEYSDVGYYGVTSAVLEDLSGALDEIAPANLTTVLGKFEDTWNELLKKGDETTGAANLKSIATQMVSVLQQMSAKVDNVWNQQEYSLKLDVDNINSILQNVAQLNDEIRRQQFNSMDSENGLYQPLELLDQRNVLLDQLSEYANIHYELQDDGQVTVWMGQKDESNPPMVEGDKFDKLSVRTDDSNPEYKTVSLFRNSTGETVKYSTGALKGSLDMMNGRGLGFDGERGEDYQQGILYYKDKIDQFARTLVENFNSVIEVVDPVTQQPYDPPQYKAMFKFEVDGDENAAGIRLSDEWEANTEYLITDLKDKIIGSSEEGGGSDNNNYAAKVAQLFTDKLDFGEFKGTLSDYISFYSNTKLSNDKSFSDTRLESVTSISETLLNQIQQVSGVSMDEEGVDMTMYKKAYDAMSRVFTTLDEMLDKLINSTGVVGR